MAFERRVGVDELERRLAGRARPARGRVRSDASFRSLRPFCSALIIVPSPRSSRSTSASSNPSVVARRQPPARSRGAAASSGSRRDQQPALRRAPRRGRPGRAAGGAGRCRSGRRRGSPSPWRWARRRRPRSRSWPPARRARRRGSASITSSFSAEVIRPCSSPRRRPASSPARSRSIGLLGRRHLELLGLLDQRAHHVGLAPGRHLRAHGVPRRGVGRAGRSAQRVDDRRAARRQLVEHADVEVAVDGHRRGARDRRGRHHQHVGHRLRRALSRSAARCSTPKRCCSSTTTTPRRWKSTRLLDERVGADGDVDARRRRGRRAARARSPPVTRFVSSSTRSGRSPKRLSGSGHRQTRRAARARSPKCCSASTSVGAISAPWCPPCTAASSARQRHHRLAANRRRPAAAGASGAAPARSASISAITRRWAPVSGKGSAAWKRRTSSPPTAWRMPTALALDRPLAQHEHELHAQQLVERQPPAGRVLLGDASRARGSPAARSPRSISSSRRRTPAGHRVGDAARLAARRARSPPSRRSPTSMTWAFSLCG